MNVRYDICCVAMLVLGAGCRQATTTELAATTAPPAHQATAAEDDVLVQYSLISALAAGDYLDGAPLTQVLADGDFGIGTFDRLDGEMIVLDGQIYQALSTGEVRRADLKGSTPFAAVTTFSEDGRIEEMAAATLDEMDEQLDRKLPRRNSPYAIRIDGTFATLTIRSVPPQTPPFEPLVKVVKDQPTWQHTGLRGTLIGLRCPEWIGTLNVSGYHWHFLSDDRKIGGHVLACQFEHALLRFDECQGVLIRIPHSARFDSFQAGQVKDQDIDTIERQRDSK